jgi:hypothetical protein
MTPSPTVRDAVSSDGDGGLAPAAPGAEIVADPAPRPAGPLAQGLVAARANVLPALVLQIVAVSILLGYYYVEPVHGALEAVSELKQRYGYAFSAVSTMMVAGLLPFVLQYLQRGGRRFLLARHLPYIAIFWAIKGMEVDAFFRVQAWMFGDDSRPATVLAKMAFDQFFYAPLWGLPSVVAAYRLKDVGFDLRQWDVLPLGRFYRRRILAALITTWAIWIPAVTVIYCLPLPLQLPLQNIVMCLWVLIFLVIAGRAP